MISVIRSKQIFIFLWTLYMFRYSLRRSRIPTTTIVLWWPHHYKLTVRNWIITFISNFMIVYCVQILCSAEEWVRYKTPTFTIGLGPQDKYIFVDHIEWLIKQRSFLLHNYSCCTCTVRRSFLSLFCFCELFSFD